MRARDNENIVDPVSEARRYVAKAHNLLNKKARIDPETQFYRKKKHIRSAGNYLWKAVLIALEAKYHLKKNKWNRVDMDEYLQRLSNEDNKLFVMVNNAYDTLHLAMGYDGIQIKSICLDGIDLANEIIDRCEHLITKNDGAE